LAFKGLNGYMYAIACIEVGAMNLLTVTMHMTGSAMVVCYVNVKH